MSANPLFRRRILDTLLCRDEQRLFQKTEVLPFRRAENFRDKLYEGK
ncbi:hypothetical protein LEP1GSC036_0676 [Leptospira weilii str. 2006001853]|uniref:Uncharacterized protein n=1 Tax=Leptospira weilii str. 2006001853 TaxID=1001589 RepID=A0A828Z420_9LEPT|nr:hypothetical protein LEP1GSC036_0676 [Leptospira weilii str. 2006001853]EMN44691.1 hypothetical protein LEP1GSC086_4166 [Leptospira weilii str. LNT 1234]